MQILSWLSYSVLGPLKVLQPWGTSRDRQLPEAALHPIHSSVIMVKP